MVNEDDFPDTQIVDISESLDEDTVSQMLDRTVAGKYRILRRLARGGMGVVYVAEHVQLGRKVVIKVLSYHLADDSRAKSRFEREARGLSVLDHPNVVTVHDFGIEKGLTYIVMEYVEGENLSQRVRRKGRIPFELLFPIMVQTIDAIAAAHAKGIVHRDVKPSNVMVGNRAGRADFVKVLDFGLAKLATQSVDITKGNLVGTVSYLSPEVIKGGEALPSADVYALGVMFYYLLSGSKPFQASDDMSVLYQHVNVEAEWLGELLPQGEAPVEFIEFIHHCMEKDPTKRPKDAAEMRARLDAVMSLPSISAFSLDSSAALPRYRPPDSSAQSIRRPSHITSPVATDSQATLERPSFEASQQSMSRPSIAMQRPKRSVRVGVIAFTTCSIGLAALVLLMQANRPAEIETPTAVIIEPPAEIPVAATTPPEARPELETVPPAEDAGIKQVQAVETAPPLKESARKIPQRVKLPPRAPRPPEPTEPAAKADAGIASDAEAADKPEPATKKPVEPNGLLSVDGKKSGLLPVSP